MNRLTVLIVAVVLCAGCDNRSDGNVFKRFGPMSQASADQFARDLTYVRDPRNGLCFAMLRSYGGDVVTLTNVPSAACTQ